MRVTSVITNECNRKKAGGQSASRRNRKKSRPSLAKGWPAPGWRPWAVRIRPLRIDVADDAAEEVQDANVVEVAGAQTERLGEAGRVSVLLRGCDSPAAFLSAVRTQGTPDCCFTRHP